MLSKEISLISMKSELCSRCYICYSVCPFEAISLNAEKLPVIDMEKCMVCGLCSSACPSHNIKPYYYNSESLIDTLKSRVNPQTDSLVISCRGSTAPDCSWLESFSELHCRHPAWMRVPCAGRLPLEFYLTVLASGIQKIVTVQCEIDFCRFKKGSLMSHSRIEALHNLLHSAGYDSEAVTIITRTQQVEYDSSKCVGCDKCAYICPYSAIEIQPLGTPRIDYQKCTGCGACSIVCPHLALIIKGYEYRPLGELIHEYGKHLNSEKKTLPSILVFVCRWADFDYLDSNRKGFISPGVGLIEIPCYSKLDPLHVIIALNSGFDGVLSVTCADNECKNKESRTLAKENAGVMMNGLKLLGLESRYQTCQTSPRKIGDLEAQVNRFRQELKGEE